MIKENYQAHIPLLKDGKESWPLWRISLRKIFEVAEEEAMMHRREHD